MIAYVPREAAFDGRLTSTAKSLLLYLGAIDVHGKKWDGVWCWESLTDIAKAMSNEYSHYSPKMIKDARYLLCKCGYLKRCVGVFEKEIKKNGQVVTCKVRRIVYRVNLQQEQPKTSTGTA